jgi:pyruvate/2-oxoglutarate dehydrogenase complex dihydrolipoamide dehydrogenase (E3) component
MAKYEPGLLGPLQAIFDQIWQEVEPILGAEDAERKRTELARMIVLAHRSGVKLEDIRATVLNNPVLNDS